MKTKIEACGWPYENNGEIGLADEPIFVGSDIGCLRLLVDSVEFLVSNYDGDGQHRVSFSRVNHPECWHVDFLVEAKKIEIAEFDCGEFRSVKTLPAGRYKILRNIRDKNGHLRILKS